MASEPKVGEVERYTSANGPAWRVFVMQGVVQEVWATVFNSIDAARLSALLTEAEEIKAENERLRFQAEMACEEPVGDCQCAGCLLANERHARGEL